MVYLNSKQFRVNTFHMHPRIYIYIQVRPWYKELYDIYHMMMDMEVVQLESVKDAMMKCVVSSPIQLYKRLSNS